ncbi:U-box domain-containing protein kinase family protein [Actinidia rufa]|uniref:RING-type E3 ubiquitin transferase n=1 Tax=Actinidia rufa TaxID=165716 RepID=A0A7J0ECI5_9ERIC|nr:U-box domain-containing protein kinase family protein [Actinidia rufa]
MGGGEGEIEIEGLCDVENTIFVAVGKNVKESKSTLLWALQSFAGKKISLLHVHEPARSVSLINEKFAVNKLELQVVKAYRELEREKMNEVLKQYLLILAQVGVQAGKVCAETDNVEKGILQIIAQHDIRWLVMGAAADKHYSKKLSEVKSKKATFVCQQAPVSCSIWFVCNGCLIYTRSRCGNLISHVGSFLRSDSKLLQSNAEVDEDADEVGGMSKGFASQVLVQSTDNLVGTSKSHPLSMDEMRGVGSPLYSLHKSQGHLDRSSSIVLLENPMDEKLLKFVIKLEHAKTNAASLKQKAFEESVKRWKTEEDAMEAIRKAEALESSCMNEIKQRKEMEEVLSDQRQELERMKNQHDQYTKELQMIEHDKAIRELGGLSKVVNENAADSFKLQFFAFSFWEINEATRDFDPSWKIGDGRYGSVYKGLLRHLKVAIKMLPSRGSQGHVEFEHEAWALSRVRHPNLVTLIGTCPESRSLVYEYLRNGNLEEHLACQGKAPPLSWQTRTKIASELCSVLIFLHSSRPCIIHGNLKPTNILLDANVVSKLSDLGIRHLIPRDEKPTYKPTFCNKTDPEDSVYEDPEFLETGELTVESDVYSFGIVLLRLLTGRPAFGIVKDVKCALERDNFSTVLDRRAGEWPLEETKTLAQLALRCCENKGEDRPDLVSEVWSVIELLRELCTSNRDCKGPHRIPSHFVCPIFQEVMKDPHIAADGFTYEADAIKGWFNSGHKTSPMTNLKLDHCDLTPNYALYNAIQEWQQRS